ncbi:MAG: hypothetical protein GY847_42270 [Proteobacteria bacterium]|nr:hypothetical protein [Pseudomonadota bacterium]
MIESSALELFKLYNTEKIEAFKLHRATLQNYLAFTIALIGAIIATIIKLGDSGYLAIALVASLALNISICILAVRMCDRYYLGALEKITILIKLEPLVGLGDIRSRGDDEDNALALPGDKHYLPQRWVDSEKDDQFLTARDFIDFHISYGVNVIARRTFYLVIIINVIIAVYLIALTLKPLVE